MMKFQFQNSKEFIQRIFKSDPIGNTTSKEITTSLSGLPAIFFNLQNSSLPLSDKTLLEQQLKEFCQKFDACQNTSEKSSVLLEYISLAKHETKALTAKGFQPDDHTYISAESIKICLISLFDLLRKEYAFENNELYQYRLEAMNVYRELMQAISASCPQAHALWNKEIYLLQEDFSRAFSSAHPYPKSEASTGNTDSGTSMRDVKAALDDVMKMHDQQMLDICNNMKSLVSNAELIIDAYNESDAAKFHLASKSITELIAQLEPERLAQESEVRFTTDMRDIQNLIKLSRSLALIEKKNKEAESWLVSLRGARHQDQFIKDLISEYEAMIPQLEKLKMRLRELQPGFMS